jgi:hypothetical protein
MNISIKVLIVCAKQRYPQMLGPTFLARSAKSALNSDIFSSQFNARSDNILTDMQRTPRSDHLGVLDGA